MAIKWIVLLFLLDLPRMESVFSRLLSPPNLVNSGWIEIQPQHSHEDMLFPDQHFDLSREDFGGAFQPNHY